MKILNSLFLLICLINPVGVLAQTESPAVHGMVLFGDKATYASHLPMFHPPHDYQLIMKVSIEDFPRSMASVHYEESKAQGDKLFTLAPQVMQLPSVISGQITRFQAALYEGHFEKGGTNLGPVWVKIDRIIYAAKLDGGQPAPDSSGTGSYLAFGENDNYFAIHLIAGSPSFDAILRVGQPYTLTGNTCRSRICSEPRKVPFPDEKLPITLKGPSDPAVFSTPQKPDEVILHSGSPLLPSADVQAVIHLETADLSH